MSAVFGHKVIKVTISEDDSTVGAKNQMLEAAGGGKCLFYAKVPVTKVNTVRNLTSLGFYVVDVNVTFECAPVRTDVLHGSDVHVCVITPEHEAAVLDIAQNCFQFSRFHLDPKIDPRLANAVKREWIANYIKRQRGEKLLVALVNGKPAGFLAVLLVERKGSPVGFIDLIGVSVDYQCHGVGQALVKAFLEDMAGRVSLVNVGTQVANIPSMRLYAKCGFLVSSASHVLHAHMDGGILQ
jgi:ribosomal protein S18 acetylase RimI-like enzyme